ncbi:MAG: DUF1622 domain-containing protein [Ilumatobacteraceae bacterium]|jgi:uncharacterized membrane protein
MTFEGAMENIALVFEAVGVAIIAIGGVIALVRGVQDFGHFERFFVDVRRGFGRPLILGLEVLVAADIIKTITVDPSLESVAVLGILVAVRIALSISLDIEVDGVVPWHRLRSDAMSRERGVESAEES